MIAANNIGAGTINSTMLAAGAVTTAALAEGAVTAAKVATATNWFALTIPNPTPSASANFGSLVAGVGSDRMLIGTRLFNTSGTLLTTFANPSANGGNQFGSSVAGVGSDRVLVSAPNENAGVIAGAGVAYLFSTGGALLSTFNNPNPANFVGFGNSVAGVGSDRVLIGGRGKFRNRKRVPV